MRNDIDELYQRKKLSDFTGLSLSIWSQWSENWSNEKVF
jgi:hypothetical protein